MSVLESTDQYIARLSSFRGIENQAKARYILYGVHENEENFPNFDHQLTVKTVGLAFICLEVACSCLSKGNVAEAMNYFEKGASLLEYNYAAKRDENEGITEFNLMVSGLAYYCGCQYSKAFVTIRKSRYETPFTQMIYNFLCKDFAGVEQIVKTILLTEPDGREITNAYNILAARAFSLVIDYFYYGEGRYLERAEDILEDATTLALCGDDPAVWWEFRLLRIIFYQFRESSLWANLKDHPQYKVDDNGWRAFFEEFSDVFERRGLAMPDWDKEAKDTVRSYIHSLCFRKVPIIELFISQRHALEKVLEENGTVVSLPTSSGKTRVAEMVILQTLLYRSTSKVLYIAPYRSLAYEMEENFATAFKTIGYSVSHLYGGAQFTSVDRDEMEDARLLIATPEKAKAILRSNADVVNSIKLVVMDEGHLLGKQDREVGNEMFTEELKYIVSHNGGKFLVLSAVLPNADDMSLWLTNHQDRVIQDDWRPSSQRLGLLCYYRNQVNLEWKGDYPCFNNRFVTGNNDKKTAVAKAAIRLAEMGSVLIYCPKTKEVMSNAQAMFQLIEEDDDIDWGDDLDWRRYCMICQETEEDKELLRYAKKGILCHHGNLKDDLRRYVERLLRKGKARFIYATNTLAQGVNLGVATVIVMNIWRGAGEKLPKNDFWNMAGRAGRSFVDTEGRILFVCDCSDRDKEEYRRRVAHEYIDELALNNAESGVGVYLRRLCEIQIETGIDFDYLLQLITENNLAGLGNDADYNWVKFFEIIDDSLYELDLRNRVDANDDAAWVDKHFRTALSVIQETDEELREKRIQIFKARVKAVRRFVGVNEMPQAFATSGIPLKAALFLEENIGEITRMADEYLASAMNLDDLDYFFYQFDLLLEGIPSERIIVPDSAERDRIRTNWLSGARMNSNDIGMAQSYYGYTVSWLLSALANRFASREEEGYQELFEIVSLVASYGLPSKWAVQIYLSGINSRMIATEVSQKLDALDGAGRLSEVYGYLKQHAEEIRGDERYSELARGWMETLLVEPEAPVRRISKLQNFQFGSGNEEAADVLFCKRYEGKTYLCSDDYRYHISVEDSDGLPFSNVADVSGVYFNREGNAWQMVNVNPYVEVE